MNWFKKELLPKDLVPDAEQAADPMQKAAEAVKKILDAPTARPAQQQFINRNLDLEVVSAVRSPMAFASAMPSMHFVSSALAEPISVVRDDFRGNIFSTGEISRRMHKWFSTG